MKKTKKQTFEGEQLEFDFMKDEEHKEEATEGKIIVHNPQTNERREYKLIVKSNPIEEVTYKVIVKKSSNKKQPVRYELVRKNSTREDK